MVDMERGKRCILCGSLLEQDAVAQSIEKDST